MTECVQQMLSYLFVNWSRKMFNPSGAQWMVLTWKEEGMSISQVDLEEITRHRIWPCLTDYRKKFKSSSLSTGNKEYKSTHNRCDKSNVIVRAEWSGARKHVVFSDSDVVSDGRGAKDYWCLRSNSRCPSLDSKRLQQLDWYPLIRKLWISDVDLTLEKYKAPE